MFLLAVCPWHIMTSRWGLDVDLAPGFLIFGFLLSSVDWKTKGTYFSLPSAMV